MITTLNVRDADIKEALWKRYGPYASLRLEPMENSMRLKVATVKTPYEDMGPVLGFLKRWGIEQETYETLFDHLKEPRDILLPVSHPGIRFTKPI